MNELRWIAQRVVDGLPVSVEIGMMRELQVSEPTAQELMAGRWSELIAVIQAETATPQRVVSRKRCPRCQAVLIERRPGHVWCVCGYSDEPADERDKVVGRDEIECPKPPDRLRYRSADRVELPWTEEERALWLAWDAGEAVPSLEDWDRSRPKGYVVKGETTPCEHCGKPLTKGGHRAHKNHCPARKAEKAAEERPMVGAE